MATFQHIVDQARKDLQDADKVRYTDAELLQYAIDGVLEARRMRPDLFFGGYGTTTTSYTLASTFPVPATYEMLFTHYIVFRAEFRDDEYAVDGRAVAFLTRFEKELTR